MTVIDCDDETYGYNCVNICSGHCLNDSPCNKTSGHCDRGCQPGYTNNRCNKGKCIDQSFFLHMLQINVLVFGLIIQTHYQLSCYFMLKFSRSS